MNSFNFDGDFYQRLICQTEYTESTPSMEEMVKEAVGRFYETFLYYPDVCAYAPGKFTIMGGQADYVAGCTVQIALPLVTVVVGRKHDLLKYTITTTADHVGLPNTIIFPSVNIKLPEKGYPHWGNYLKGIVHQYPEQDRLAGCDALIHSSIPPKQGHGSSAALQVAFYTFMEALSGRTIAENTLDKALLCKKVEELFANARSERAWDNVTCTIGARGHGVFIDSRGEEVGAMSRSSCAKLFRMSDPNMVFMVTRTNVPLEVENAELVATRAAQLTLAARLLGMDQLEDLDGSHLEALEQVNQISIELVTTILEELKVPETRMQRILQDLFYQTEDGLDDKTLGEEESDEDSTVLSQGTVSLVLRARLKLMKYLRYVVTENERSCSIPGDCSAHNYSALGKKLTNSHYSFKEDYMVSCPVADMVVEMFLSIRGVLGAKMVRGGSVLTLLHRNSLKAAVEKVGQVFTEAVFQVIMPSHGPGILSLENRTFRKDMGFTCPSVDAVVKKALRNFETEFHRRATHGSCSPGVVRLFGEHEDYNQGISLAMAVPMATVVVGAINSTTKIRVATTAEVSPEQQKIVLRVPDQHVTSADKTCAWSAYIRDIPGFDSLVQSSVPQGCGLSSSSALEVAMCTFLETLTGATIKDTFKKAYICMKVEHEYAKSLCGMTKQVAAIAAKKGFAIFLDLKMNTLEYIPFQNVSCVFLMTILKPSQDSKDLLLTRLEECYQAAKALQLEALGEAKTSDMDVLVALGVDETVVKRARYIIAENDRTLLAVEALANHNYVTLGQIMVQSHNSLRDDFEMCSPTEDLVVQGTLQMIGVLGAKKIGSVGCSTVTLVRRWAVASVIDFVKETANSDPVFHVLEPFGGAQVLDLPPVPSRKS